MKKVTLSILLLMIMALSAYGQSEITRTVFIPPEYYIGDPVELRIQLELERYNILTVPLNLDELEWVEISDVEVIQNQKEVEIVIRFTSFSPGTRALPYMDFGPFVLDDFKIYTKSLVEEGETDLMGLRQQVMIPGSRLYFFLILLGIVVLPYAFYFLIKLLMRYTVILFKKYHAKRPYRTLSRVLKKLEANVEKTTVREFFIALTDALRDYLTIRTGHDCKSATTSEISRLHGFGLDQTLWERLVSVLKQGDMVKFGGETQSHEEMKETIQFVTSVCQDIEKREGFHVDL